MITRKQLLEWDMATAKATEGPWVLDNHAVMLETTGLWLRIANCNMLNDAEFIAAARIAMPLLLAEIKILKDAK